MADNSKIEWTDATWQVITGCKITSPGCTNCYAMNLAGTRLRNHPSREGLTQQVNGKHVWTGEVRFNEQWLLQPLQWSKPRMVFVVAHGDLFAEAVKDDWLDQIFAVMALAPQHTFQVLTKRPERMREYLVSRNGMGNTALCKAINLIPFGLGNRKGALEMPLPNVWLGVSVEDQRHADQRIPILLDTPSAVRWISAEPLLGPIDLVSTLGGTLWIGGQRGCGGEHYGIGTPDCPRHLHHHHDERCKPGLDWVVAGGESGKSARPMHPDWARSLRDQCAAAGVPFLFKQWGAHLGGTAEDHGDGVFFTAASSNKHDRWLKKSDKFGWLDSKKSPDGPMWLKLKKSEAGRLLDGVEHNGFPRRAA
ncbi:protein gp37 [Agrobacterium vitis]|nr:protein gp37 [Agrobacterium vitis]